MLIIITLGIKTSSFAQDINNESAIENMVKQYEKGLNNSNIEELAQLFTVDGVLVLQETPTIIRMGK